VTEDSREHDDGRAAARHQPVGFRPLPEDRGFTMEVPLHSGWPGWGRPHVGAFFYLTLGVLICGALLRPEPPGFWGIVGWIVGVLFTLGGGLFLLGWFALPFVEWAARSVDVRVERGVVRARFRVLGVPVWRRTFHARDIEQLYVRGSAGSWDVIARTKDGRTQPFARGLDTREQAHYVESAVERHLGIAPKPEDDPPVEPPSSNRYDGLGDDDDFDPWDNWSAIDDLYG
jgi:hypothetical protein